MESKSWLRPDTPLPVNNNGSHVKQSSVSPSMSELLVASRKGYTSEVQRILGAGGGSVPAHTVHDRHGRNCLHLACHYDKLETVQAILNTELIDVNSTSKRGFTPLHEASGEGHLKIVFLLLAMGAFLKARSKEGWTALMSACYNGHNDVAKVLIAAGLDVNATNKNGFTALHVAAWKGNSVVIEMLLKEGALISLQTSSKKTALDIAQEENQLEAITILQAASVRESEKPFFRIAALEGQLKMMQDKLLHAKQTHDEILRTEREEMAKQYEQVKHQLRQELAIEEGSKLTPGLENTTSASTGPIENSDIPIITTSMESPTVKTTNTIVKGPTQSSRESAPIMVSPHLTTYSPSIPKPRLQPRKKSERKTIDSLCLDSMQESSETSMKARRSLDGLATVVKVSSGDKLTITQLVENSMQSPGTIASIRKQLKEDGLTPKIKKKFEKQELPAVKDINHSEKSSIPIEYQKGNKQ